MNTPVRQTCSTALISLIFGILSWMLLPFVGAVVAIISGHLARSEIRRAPDRLEGDGLAVGGLVLGYLHLAMILLFIVAVFLFFGGLAFFIALSHRFGHA
jgi:dihydroorotate dehydrogenase